MNYRVPQHGLTFRWDVSQQTETKNSFTHVEHTSDQRSNPVDKR
jgi:hypothetical protein